MAARILVADDSVTIQKVVELTFSKEDVVLIQARSGEEAIRKAREARPDLVLLDLVMPDKSGYEVCAALRSEPMLSTVPIILLTGTFEAFDRNEGLRAGANDFVTKPFESQVLISKVKQLLFAKTVEREKPEPVSGLFPPTEEISQDRLWQALDSIPPPTPPEPPGGSGELHLEDLATLPVPPSIEVPALELASPGAGSAQFGPGRRDGQEPPAIPSDDLEMATLPEALSLEELLASPPAALPLALEIEPLLVETLPGEPVFDLTADMEAPALPLVEVGTGEPPAFSVGDPLDRSAITHPPGVETEPVGPRQVEREALPAETLPGEPVFDLTADMEAPALPLVEVGTGEPPAFSVDDLLRSTEGVLPEKGAAGLPWADFEPASGAPLADTPLGEEFPGSAIQLKMEDTPESSVGIPAAAPPESQAALEVPAPPVSPLTSEAAPLTEALAPPVAFEGFDVAAVPAPEVVVPDIALAPPAAPHVEAVFPRGVDAGPSADLGAMRQAVTERVAHDLAQELSDKLLERIDRIVREVVPDLAEILITKEIERIRALAEGKPST